MVTPTVSFQTVAGTFSGSRDETRDRILAPKLVEFLGEDSRDASLLSFVFNVDGDIPADGLEVVVDVDSNFAEYFSGLGRQPFGGGGEVLGAVYEEDGVTPKGIKFLLTSSKALFSISAAETEEAETDGPETLDFALAAGDGYSVNSNAQSSTVTFYDTLADVPDLGAGPQISLSANQTELIETEGTELTLTFNVDGEIPEGGVLVYVNSETRGAVGEFNVFAGEISGGILPPPNFAVSGFYFTILEDGASITVPVFDETTNPEIPPEAAIEGIEDFTFSMVEGPGYTIDPDASSISYSIADAPGALPLVSLSTSPNVLIESEGTVSIHTFMVSTAPPAEGITVSVDAPNLSEFDLAQIVVTGGEIAGVNADGTGFDFTITASEATIELPVADDGETEAVEEAVFTLVAGEGYILNPETSSGTFAIAGTPASVPAVVEESNDTIATAIATGLTADNNIISINSDLDQQSDPAVDRTEDVDMYSVELAAGDVLQLDIDAQAIFDESPNSFLRLFDAAGNELASSDDDPAPGELFAPGRRDSYVAYTAETAGTYYVGVSSFPNGDADGGTVYDPNVAGSGTGRSFGDYQLNLSLNGNTTPEATVIAPSTGDGPAISLSATPGTYSRDDNLLASNLVQFVEDRGASILTLGLTTDSQIPEDGIEVFLKSNVDLTSVFSSRTPFSPNGAEVLGAVYDEAGTAVGLRVLLTANTAILNLNLDNADEAPTDGVETVSITLEPSAGYTVGAGTISAVIYDTLADVPVSPNVPTVSIAASETALVESEGNLTTLTFTLDSPPPAEGVLINVDSGIRGALGEFDVLNAEVTGGDFPSPNFQASGFFFRLTEQTATITLAAFDETTNDQVSAEDALEGIDEFTFTVQPGVGYAVSPDAGEIALTIADNPDSVVIPGNGDGDGDGEEPAIPFETELNDTLATATDTGLSADNPSFTLQAEINATRETRNRIDATEDVDMYAFQMQAGDTVKIDIDSIPYELEGFEDEQRVDTELRIFNAAGEELVLNTEGSAPGELFESGRDAYVEFTATEAGTYYAGVALLSNRAYDPMVEGSGSGRVFPDSGINVGEYTIEATLVSSGTGPGPVTDIVGDADDNTLEGTAGNDIIAGDLGNDVIMGLGGDDILRGDLNSRNPQNAEMGGNDIIFGGEGNDRIGGKSGNDILSGDAGDDFIWGDAGDDIIMGVTGNDILVGGSGSDLFVFGNGDGTDTILDFEVGTDRIGLVEGELTFADLTLTQDGNNTMLGVASSGETLSILQGVQASSLTESSFAVVPDVSNPEEALALI